jgi:hypothetical protein
LPIIRDKEGKTLIDGRNRLVFCHKQLNPTLVEV